MCYSKEFPVGKGLYPLVLMFKIDGRSVRIAFLVSRMVCSTVPGLMESRRGC